MGIHNLYPADLNSLPNDCQYQIFIHKTDIKEIDMIPNLCDLKVFECHLFQFFVSILKCGLCK